MSQTQTVIINGRTYNALTGLPVDQQAAPKEPASETVKITLKSRPSSQSAANIHSHTQKSQTLNRAFTKKPEFIKDSANPAAVPVTSNVRSRQIIQKSPAISKFAPHPQPMSKAPASMKSVASATPRRQMNDIAPVSHPTALKAQQIQTQKRTQPAVVRTQSIAPTPQAKTIKPEVVKSAPVPAQEIKNRVIEQALKNAPDKKEQTPKRRSFFARHPRLLSIGSASMALVLLGGYFTYLNLPDISVRVAAAQAGIDASYPDYQPDGYRLNGPVATQNGKVEMKFASNAGPQNFKITQEKSSWDSSAIVANLVRPQSNDSYITTNERGLTIYTYDGNAAWVNGGILYTIEGDAPLSSEQIRRIATSL